MWVCCCHWVSPLISHCFAFTLYGFLHESARLSQLADTICCNLSLRVLTASPRELKISETYAPPFVFPQRARNVIHRAKCLAHIPSAKPSIPSVCMVGLSLNLKSASSNILNLFQKSLRIMSSFS